MNTKEKEDVQKEIEYLLNLKLPDADRQILVRFRPLIYTDFIRVTETDSNSILNLFEQYSRLLSSAYDRNADKGNPQLTDKERLALAKVKAKLAIALVKARRKSH